MVYIYSQGDTRVSPNLICFVDPCLVNDDGLPNACNSRWVALECPLFAPLATIFMPLI